MHTEDTEDKSHSLSHKNGYPSKAHEDGGGGGYYTELELGHSGKVAINHYFDFRTVCCTKTLIHACTQLSLAEQSCGSSD